MQEQFLCFISCRIPGVVAGEEVGFVYMDLSFLLAPVLSICAARRDEKAGTQMVMIIKMGADSFKTYVDLR